MRIRVNAAPALTVATVILVAANIWLYQGKAQELERSRSEAMDDLYSRLHDKGHVKIDGGTGMVDFASIDNSASGSLSDLPGSATSLEKSLSFLKSYGAAFG